MRLLKDSWAPSSPDPLTCASCVPTSQCQPLAPLSGPTFYSLSSLIPMNSRVTSEACAQPIALSKDFDLLLSHEISPGPLGAELSSVHSVSVGPTSLPISTLAAGLRGGPSLANRKSSIGTTRV